MTVQDYQARQDADHLNILSILYLVFGILMFVGAAAVALYISMIGFMMSIGSGQTGMPGGLFIVFGLFAGGLVAAIGGLLIYASKCLRTHRDMTWVMVAAALCCLHMPLGTLLGIFTFIVLSRPSVKALFGQP